MERVVSKTVDVLTRIGERIERRLSTGDDDDSDLETSGSSTLFHSSESAFRRPFINNDHNLSQYQGSSYSGTRRYSSDNLAAMPSGYRGFDQYLDNPMNNPYADRLAQSAYGAGLVGPMNYGYSGSNSAATYGGFSGNVGYAPDYYVAERRQFELVPAPPPRYIREPVPVPVDRPVPQPYPVKVPVQVPVDRPVPIPMPTPVPVDRPVPVPVDRPVPVPVDRPVPVPVDRPVPVPVPVPVSVPSAPIQVPVPVPSPVPCYVPIALPVPSPPPSPIMTENSVTYTQRWIDSSSNMTNQQYVRPGSPVIMNPSYARSASPIIMNQSYARPGSPFMMDQQHFIAGSPVMGTSAYATYGYGPRVR